MKQEIFNKYVKKVCQLFDLTNEEVFTKSKMRERVDARHLLYYLCSKRPNEDYLYSKVYERMVTTLTIVLLYI